MGVKMNIISVNQFTVEMLESIFKRTDEMIALSRESTGRKQLASRHMEKQMCSIFYEPSTRTRTSFETAALKLGMGVVSTENAREFSSAAKGETLEDTFRVLNGYDFDVIVMRHHQTGAAAKAAAVSKTPLINAGDGKGEHPTQALLDAFTIRQRFGRLSNLNIVMGGDLANGRTVRSLSQLLSQFKGNRLSFVSQPQFQIGQDIKSRLKQSNLDFQETDNVQSALKNADVVYWTRLQKERLDDKTKNVTGGFIINEDSLNYMKKDAIIMHPLPRVDEIAPAVDDDPRAYYFKQAGNGLYVRMALIDLLLSGQLA
ncbi:MAG TPA: aspartate carbamoyltransferase [Candidatus Saccharimonadales bacterium]|nr:aspartate carbamoyltransferase [Candidatus Saccharimonadales bacterium]